MCVEKNKYEVLELNGGYHVYVQYGDLFSEAEVTNPSMRRNIVIPVNRCFDTKVDDDFNFIEHFAWNCTKKSLYYWFI